MNSIDPNRLDVLALAPAKTDDIVAVLAIRKEIQACLAELVANKPPRRSGRSDYGPARGGKRSHCGGDPN